MHTLLTSVLAAAVLTLAGTGPSTTAAALHASAQDDATFEALEKEFERADLEWRIDHRKAKKESDEAAAKVLERDPVKTFYPRFAALADAGSARAAFWMAQRIERYESDPEKIAEQRKDLLTRAARGLAPTRDAKDFLKEIGKAHKAGELDTETVEALYLEIGNGAKDAEVGAGALFARAKLMYARAASDEDRRLAFAALEQIVARHPDTKIAQEVDSELYVLRNLVVGAVAPDFTTQDVEGVEFKLTDYRGKVVLLDFWGFW